MKDRTFTPAMLPRLVTKKQLLGLRAQWRRTHKRIVFTNGVFDILHRGHVDLLNKAKSFGDILVVGVNSDKSVRRLKGPSRPLNREHDRAALLLALRPVDVVCLFPEDTPFALISALEPDVLVKGAEYRVREIVGADVVRGLGGRVRRVKMLPGHSSTALIRRANEGV